MIPEDSLPWVVSISLGSSKRDKSSLLELGGKTFKVERRGTDGDFAAFARLFSELDGKAAALGVGGADIWLKAGGKAYAFKDVERAVAGARSTPVVDGSGLKHTLERSAILWMKDQDILDFEKSKVMLVSAVDRFGMAEALAQVCPKVVYGDFIFGLGIPIPISKLSTVAFLGKLLLPIITRLPIQTFYPTGEKQEKRTPKFAKFFEEADLIAGDWHFIRRFAPENLTGKRILTQTLRKADLEWLKSIGLHQAITTTPEVGGETFATNVMEAVLAAEAGRRLTESEIEARISTLGWVPRVWTLNPLPLGG